MSEKALKDIKFEVATNHTKIKERTDQIHLLTKQVETELDTLKSMIQHK